MGFVFRVLVDIWEKDIGRQATESEMRIINRNLSVFWAQNKYLEKIQ